MDETRRNSWAQVGAGLFAGGLALVAIMLSVLDRTRPRWWVSPLFIVSVVVTCVGAVILVWVLWSLLRSKAIRYRTQVSEAPSGARRLTLKRRDSHEVGASACAVTGPDKRQMEASPIASGTTVSYTFPDNFKPTLPENLSMGRHKIRWHVSRRGTSVRAEFAERPTARARFKVTREVRDRAHRVWRRGRYVVSHEIGSQQRTRLRLFRHEEAFGMVGCYVSRHLSDGTFGRPFLGVLDSEHTVEKAEGPEGVLIFPDDFRREVRQVRRLTPVGAVGDYEYENASGESGEYIVRWVEVWYVQGGAFPVDHEITVEDFRREREVACYYFVLPHPEDVVDPSAEPDTL